MSIFATILTIAATVNPVFVNHNDVKGDTQTMTNIAQWAESVTPSYSWVRPDEWMLKWQPAGTMTHQHLTIPVTNYYRIFTNDIVSTTSKLNAQMVPTLVDETSMSYPNVTNYAVVGATVTSAGYCTSSSNGVFRVSAYATTGIRYADVFLQGNVITATTNVNYCSDVSGSGTKFVNDHALTQLAAATKVGDYTRNGTAYSIYNSQKVYMTSTGAGNVSEFAVSAHILGTAAHYGSSIRWLGNQSFTDADGNTATVTKKEWVNLRDWAMANGWMEQEIRDAGAWDIAFVVCDTATAIPDGCIPYFMDYDTATLLYHEGEGVQCWRVSQYHDYAMPETLISFASSYPIGVSTYYDDYAIKGTRADILARLQAMSRQDYMYSGDSGKPTFLIDRLGRPVVLYGNTYGHAGANWVKGFDIIKAFVEAHGDTLKVID